MAVNDTLEFFTAHRAEYPASDFPQPDERNDRAVIDFDDNESEYCYFTGRLNDNYSGRGVKVLLGYMMSSATSGNIRVTAAFERYKNSEDYDSDHFAAEQIELAAVPGTSGYRIGIGITFTDGGQMDDVHTGWQFRLKVKRTGDHADDTASGDLELLYVVITEE